MRIAIDAMGGELGVQATIAGIYYALQGLKDPSLRFLVFGRKSEILPLANKYRLNDMIAIVDVEDVVLDTDHPFKIFQTGNNTSMGRALLSVQEGLADGVVSSGSTSGYVTLAHKIFGLMPHVLKIALPAIIPSQKGQSLLLDVGASITATENDLVQFAIMGSLLYTAQFGGEAPPVGLLNIGTEDNKGPLFIKKANALLKSEPLVNYTGFVEGTDLFKGDVSIIVTDGYAGNIALKAVEGIALFIGDTIKEALGGSLWRKLGSLGAIAGLRQVKQKIDKRRYNGVVLLGLNHLAVKSHGSADAQAFSCAIGVAHKVIKHELIDKVRVAFGKMQAGQSSS